MCFILRSDKIRYGDMLEELRNGIYKGRDEYPTTIPDALKILMRTYRQIVYVQRHTGRSSYRAQDIGRGEGLIFAQHVGHGGIGGRGNDTDQAALPGRNDILHEKIRCYSCHQNGHYSDQCTNQTSTIWHR